MISIKPILRKVDFVTQRVLDAKRVKENYAYWSLFLDDNRKNPREIDTCATSLCVSLLSESIDITKNDEVMDVVRRGLNTLIRIRKDNGSWPSVVEPKIIGSSEKIGDGIVAIGDTYFALSALLDTGFLRRSFPYDLVFNDLSTVEKRWDYVLKSAEWLISNRSENVGSGWYYTDEKNESKSYPTVLATSNVAILFSRILQEQKKSIIDFSKGQEKTLCNIRNAYEKAVEMFLVFINEDGGIGNILNSDEVSSTSYLHTARLIDVLVSRNKLDDKDDLKNAIQYVLNNYDNTIKTSINPLSSELYVERYELTTNDGGEISIFHENYIEGILSQMLLNIYRKSADSENICSLVVDETAKSKICVILDDLMSRLIKLQGSNNKRFNGLFKCRVGRAEGAFPVYSSYYGVQSALMYQKTFSPSKNSTEMCDSSECEVTCRALLTRLQSFENKYGLQKDKKELLVLVHRCTVDIEKYLEELKESCSNERLLEIDLSLREIQAFYEVEIGEDNE